MSFLLVSPSPCLQVFSVPSVPLWLELKLIDITSLREPDSSPRSAHRRLAANP
jgi:hypothetical protein